MNEIDKNGYPAWIACYPGWMTDRYSRSHEKMQYLVHDGMVLYPVCKFIELVLKDDALKNKYGNRALIYKDLIIQVFIRKWEKYWVQFDDGTGTYKSTESPAEVTPGRLLPFNHVNALGSAFLVLQDLDTDESGFLKRRAAAIAGYFRKYLKPSGDAWVWNYQETGDSSDTSAAEDSSHASINVGMALEAYHRDVVFTRSDMERFCNTLLHVMWNGSMNDPVIGRFINDNREITGKTPIFHGRHWIEFCEFNPGIYIVYKQVERTSAFIPKTGRIINGL